MSPGGATVATVGAGARLECRGDLNLCICNKYKDLESPQYDTVVDVTTRRCYGGATPEQQAFIDDVLPAVELYEQQHVQDIDGDDAMGRCHVEAHPSTRESRCWFLCGKHAYMCMQHTSCGHDIIFA